MKTKEPRFYFAYDSRVPFDRLAARNNVEGSPSLSEAEGSVLSLSKGSPLPCAGEGGDPAVAGLPTEGVRLGRSSLLECHPGKKINFLLGKLSCVRPGTTSAPQPSSGRS